MNQLLRTTELGARHVLRTCAARRRIGRASLLCIILPGIMQAVTYSFTGTYSTYSVTMSFDTSLTGAALDNLSSDNITATVSNFKETNTIPGSGTAALEVIISTDFAGNITDFKITDTSGRVVTKTSDTGPVGPPTQQTTYTAPPMDTAGHSLMTSNVQAGNELFAYYGYGIGYCVYDVNTGEPTAPGNTDPACPATAVANVTTIPGTSVSATGSGTWTSNPPNPGAPPPVSITSLQATPNVLWPPNHEMVPVKLARQTSGGGGNISCMILSVSSTEPTDPDGDWQFTGNPEDLTLSLRAERLGTRVGTGNGRVYTIKVQCADKFTSATKTTTVLVPHDQMQ